MEQQENKSVVRQDEQGRRLGLKPNGSRNREADEAQLDFSEVWNTLREGKWIILLTCNLIAGAIAAYTFMQDSVYEASSIVAIEAQSQEASAIAGVGGMQDPAGEIGFLKHSLDLAAQVARQMREVADSVERKEQFPVLLDEHGKFLSDREVGEQLLERTTFQPMPERNMIQVLVQSERPEEAALVANLYADEYVTYSRKKSRASVASAREFLEAQVAKRVEEIRSLEQQWEEFAQENQVTTQGQDGSRLVQEYTGLRSRQDQLQFELEQERSSRELIKRQLEQFKPGLRGQVAQEQESIELQSQIEAVNTQISQLKADAEAYYINNSDLRGRTTSDLREGGFAQLAEIEQQVEGFEERKKTLIDRLVSQSSEAASDQEGALTHLAQLRSRITEHDLNINQLETQINALDQKIATYEIQIQDLPRQKIEQQRLEQKLAQAREFYNQLVGQLQQIIIQEESELGYARQVRSASVPLAPVEPNIPQNITLGILLGLGFGIGLAFLRRAVSSSLRTPEDVQENGYSLVGVIPQMDQEIKTAFKGKDRVEVNGRQVSTRLMPLVNPWSSIAENYRLVRTNLQHAQSEVTPQAVLVTSAEPGEGKTLTSVNLAIAMAQNGRQVLLIDADLRRPNVHKLLDLSAEPGIAEYLDLKESGDVPIVPTGIDGLHLLPAGRASKPPAEIVGSDRMEDLIAKLRGYYDTIIIDSPPVLAVSDPVLLAQQADATLLVISADQTNAEALKVTDKTLKAVGASISGVIFNRFEGQNHRYTYGYGYRYGYAQSNSSVVGVS